MPIETTVTRELACQLTRDELLERGDAIATAELRVEELKVERRRLNAAIREQTDRRAELATVIESERETRDVTCRWTADYTAKVWKLVREDTRDEVADERRQMTEADLQGRLFTDADDEINTDDDEIEDGSEDESDDESEDENDDSYVDELGSDKDKPKPAAKGRRKAAKRKSKVAQTPKRKRGRKAANTK